MWTNLSQTFPSVVKHLWDQLQCWLFLLVPLLAFCTVNAPTWYYVIINYFCWVLDQDWIPSWVLFSYLRWNYFVKMVNTLSIDELSMSFASWPCLRYRLCKTLCQVKSQNYSSLSELTVSGDLVKPLISLNLSFIIAQYLNNYLSCNLVVKMKWVYLIHDNHLTNSNHHWIFLIL